MSTSPDDGGRTYTDALFKAAFELGRATEAMAATRADFVELRGFVNEQLTVNYGDLVERVGKLESRATAQRASWKTLTAIGAAITAGASGIAAAIDWLRTHH